MLCLEIDVASVRHNIGVIRRYTASEISAVIKANCYGHGLELAKFIEPYVDSFSVSSTDEARAVRQLGIEKKIYILGSINQADFELIKNAVYTVCSKQDIDFLQNFGYNFDVALKINTGMNRLGAELEQIDALCLLINNSQSLHLDSVYTHFYDVDRGSHVRQFYYFEQATLALDTKKHCCASNCLKVAKPYHADMVRCGLAIYGYGHKELIPALRAYSTISQINEIEAGDYVGYGDYLQKKPAKIAIIRAGYADGYRRVHRQQYASALDKRLPIVGQVSMDMTAVDITNTPLSKGDRIYLIDQSITAQSLASDADTVVYEILTGFNNPRIKRTYINYD